MAAWIAANRVAVERTDTLLAEIKAAAQIDLALATTAEMTAVVDAITTTDQRSTP